MKKQMYKIEKADWLVTCLKGKSVKYFYAITMKEAKAWATNRIGIIQYFKLSYEFRDVKSQKVSKK